MRSTKLESRADIGARSQVADLPSLFAHSRRYGLLNLQYAIVFSFLIALVGGLIGSLTGCQAAVNGRERLANAAPREVLRIGTSGDYSPFSRWPADESEPAGFSISIARAYAEVRGVDLAWIHFAWPELAIDLEADRFDFAVSGITVRPDRSTRGRFSLPVTTSGAIALVHKASPIESTEDLDRSTLRIAVNAGGHLERVARRLFPSARIHPVANNAEVLDQLLHGHADAVLTDTLEAPHWQRIAETRLRTIGPFTRDRKAAWFSVDRAGEVERFNRWLLATEASGELGRLRDRFDLPSERTASPLPALLASLDERLALMRAVADAKQVLGIATENLEREELVLDGANEGVRRAAERAGIEVPNSLAIRRLFRTQIEAAKWIQTRHRATLPTESNSTDRKANGVAQRELEQVIRPALIFLGDRISMLLVACIESDVRSLSQAIVHEALASHELPDRHLQAIHQALSEIFLAEPRAGHRSSHAHTIQ